MSVGDTKTINTIASDLSSTLEVNVSVLSRGDGYVINIDDRDKKLAPHIMGRVRVEVELLNPSDPMFYKLYSVAVSVFDAATGAEEYYVKARYYCANCSDIQSLVAEIAERTRRTVLTVQAMHNTIRTLQNRGFEILVASNLDNSFYLKAKSIVRNIELTIDARKSRIAEQHKPVDLYITLSSPLNDFISCSHLRYVLEEQVKNHPSLHDSIIMVDRYSSKGGVIDISVELRELNQVPEMVALVHAVIDSEVKRVSDLVEKLDPSEATALYLIDEVSRNVLSNYLYDKLGVRADRILWWRVREYVKDVFKTEEPWRLTPLEVLVPALYDAGRLTLDSDGYLVLDGKRIVDVVKKYTDGETKLEAWKRSRLVKANVDSCDGKLTRVLLLERNVDLESVFKNLGAIPKRILKVLVLSEKLAKKYAHLLVGNQDVWNNLSQKAKARVIAINPDVLTLARDNSWTWVLNDHLAVANGLVKTIPEHDRFPSKITETLVNQFPEFFGENFRALRVGGEVFVEIGNVVLQVVAVREKCIVAQGTVVGNPVGMVVRCKTIEDAVREISSKLVDSTIEFFKLVKEQNLEVRTKDRYKTPLFTIPMIRLSDGGWVVKIPLQPGISSAVSCAMKKLKAKTRREEKVEEEGDKVTA